MITEHEELARHRIADQTRSAEDRARRREDRIARLEQTRRIHRSTVPAPRRELAGLLRRLADRLEPQPTPSRGPGLSVVR